MKICGIQKTTLLDFPGHVAATIFTGGCNFRCPFCHNSDLLDSRIPAEYSEAEVLSFLKRRTGILEGVAITGGEPTLQPDLKEFILKIRQLGLRVKLDTNGYRPQILHSLCKDGLLDYIAMDIKTCKERYAEVSGLPSVQLEKIEESIRIIMDSKIPYEFRTTAVQGLHSKEDFEKIGAWISGCDYYYIQNFTDSEHVLQSGFSGFPKEKLVSFLDAVRPYVKNVSLRGIDS